MSLLNMNFDISCLDLLENIFSILVLILYEVGFFKFMYGI